MQVTGQTAQCKTNHQIENSFVGMEYPAGHYNYIYLT